MTMDHGSGVSRTLSPKDRSFAQVVWQKSKPPLDAEMNLMGSVDLERARQVIASQMPSGFFLDPTRATQDFQFHKQWANFFKLGAPRAAQGTLDSDEREPVVFANVNGYIVAIAGTDITSSEGVENIIKLYPPPESDTRVDFVFLEVWTALVQPNPSTLNKPTASTLWKYGNVKHGGTNIADDLEDPRIGFETTKRVQIQYRIRVFGEGLGQGAGVALSVHPNGLGDPNVLGQGAASSPAAGYRWTNMREELGDPSLWRSGNGDAQSRSDLGTVDGYTYAIPICAIFRRSSETYVAVTSSGNPTQNGAFLRTPGARTLTNPLDGARTLLTPTLGASLSSTAGVASPTTVAVSNLNGSGLEDSALVLSSTFLRINGEIVGISAVDLVGGTITIPAGGRGRYGTDAVGHAAGSTIEFFNTRPDGRFADEISETDLLDLRYGINAGDWDFQRLLDHNIGALAKGTLRTAWKESNPGDTEGPVVHEVVELYAGNTATPNHTDAADGPDGIRTIWSDAATIQPDVTLLLPHDATRDGQNTVGFTNGALDTNVEWDVGADFKPAAFFNQGDLEDGWYNGSSLHLWIGGSTGESGARGTFRASGVRDVRFVTPQEYWRSGYPVVDQNNGNQQPFTLRFINEKQHEAPPGALPDDQKALYPGPMYPWRETRFERPFIVLGGILNSILHYEGVNVSNLSSDATPRYYIDLTTAGANFDAVGGFHNLSSGVFPNDPSQVATPVLRGERTLYGMLTNNGRDRTGASSEVYVVLWGDVNSRENNGCFRVVGAGTVGYTTLSAPNAGSIVVEPCSPEFTGWADTGSGQVLTVEFRSQWHNADDVSDYDARIADCVVVLTDIGGVGGDNTPWDLSNVGDLALAQSGAGGPRYSASKAVLSTTLLYHPGRSATTRVPDEIVRFAMRGGAEATIGTYLRRSPASLDTTFSAIGTPTDETYWPLIHVQTWNRLSALGWHAPDAPDYGGNVVGFTEQDRESEVFVDRGSKTVVFRPFRNRDMTLKAMTWGDAEFDAGDCLLGSYTLPNNVIILSKDPLNILTGDAGDQATTGKRMGFPVPREFMPRFGRQDIPYYRLADGATPSLGGFMPGINHLFTDVTDLSNPVFNIIGGEANAGGTEVNPLFFVTRPTEIAYARGNSNYGPQGIGALGARKTTDIDPSDGPLAREVLAALRAVNSSDLGRGLQGIQMPPYIGIARLFGVYEFEDYQNKGGTTFANNRYEMEANSAVNLIREDADKQTLFILQDGAKDFTGEVDDHTYIIPSNVLDLTRIPAAPGVHDGFVEGSSVFGDFDYVVEATVFFFAKGFINKTNVVLTRRRSGTYALNTDGDDPELENVPMCIPSPAGVNDRLYVAYNRTVYQGDPFMTRDGRTRQEADYENRYGRLAPSQAWLLRTAVQQFDSAGNFIPQMENERAFQVLASRDFVTTLGTGKIGGRLFPGTPLDVGHISSTPLAATRMPLTENARDWRVDVRAFSEGQKSNTSRARATLELLDNAGLLTANSHDDAFFVRFILLDGQVVTLYGAAQGFADAVLEVAPNNIPEEDIFIIDQTKNNRNIIYQFVNRNFGTLTPAAGSSALTLTMTAATHPEVADIPTDVPVSVVVNATQRYTVAGWGDVIFTARHVSAGDVEVTAHFPVQPTPFDTLDPATLRNVRVLAAWDPPNLVADATTTQTFAWVGADPALEQVFVVEDNLAEGVYVTAYASNTDEITVRIKNLSGVDQNIPSTQFKVAMLADVDLASASIDLSAVGLVLDVSWEQGSKDITADNLVSVINAHPDLRRTLTAFNDGTPKLTLQAVPTGAEGNGIRVETGIASFGATVGANPLPELQDVFRLDVPSTNEIPVGANTTATNLFGGVDLPVNAGDGTNQIALTGMTERLPLGVLVQDSDFLCENPLGDKASALSSSTAPLRPIQSLMPLSMGGDEYTRFTATPGELLAMADVQVAPNSWAAWTEDGPDGASKKFRIYRGGGAAFVLSGPTPGGPVDWMSASFPKSSQPVLKGGMLACRALLVRNFYEEALPADGPAVMSQGDEIQMVILTYAHMGDGDTVRQGITLDGIISPSGYGEGYAAADRYRCEGRPMLRGFSRHVPDPSQVQLAVYPEDQRGEE